MNCRKNVLKCYAQLFQLQLSMNTVTQQNAKFFLLQNHWKMLKIHWVSFLGRNVEVDTLQKFIYNFIIGNNIQH
jgi:hypothetical protein